MATTSLYKNFSPKNQAEQDNLDSAKPQKLKRLKVNEDDRERARKLFS